MINFINTDIVESGSRIGIGVYYGNKEKAVSVIDKLIEGEDVKSIKKYENGREVELVKNGVQVRIYTLPASDSSRGYKHNYSLVDSNLFADEKGYEFLKTRIYSSTVNYNVKKEFRFNDSEIRIMLY